MSATNSFLGRYAASLAGGMLVLAAFGFSRFPALAPVPGTGERYAPFALDPATTPIHPGRQALFGLSVALVYGVLQVLHIVFGLFFALVIVAGIRGLSLHVGALLGWLGQERTREDRGRRPAAAAVLSGSAGAPT